MELSFARSPLLWGLWLAVLPLLIHLLQRHRVRRQPFAAMDFLLRVQRQEARRLRIKQLLLLLLRTGLVAALVLAAAGPRLLSARSGAARLRLNALVLDASLSLQARADGRSAFEQARRRALELVATASEDNRWCLLLAGARTETLLAPCAASPADLSRKLSALRPGVTASDLTESARQAARLLDSQPAAGQAERYLWLLSDGAAHAFPGGGPAIEGARVILETVTASASRDNLGLAALDVDERDSTQLQVLVKNFGREQQGVRLELVQEDLVLASGFLDLPAGGAGIKIFAPASASDGLLAVRLQAQDALEADNRRELWWRADAALGVLLVDGDPRPTPFQDEVYFLEQALRPGSRGARYQISVLPPEKLTPAALERIRVVALANVRQLEPAQDGLLENFVRAGGGLLIGAGDRLDVEASSESLSPLLPAAIRDVVDLNGGGRGLFFGRLDQGHPVLAIFSGEESEALRKISFRRSLVLEPMAGRETRVLAEFENGLAALVDSPLGAGRVVFFSSTLDLDWNDWPARASYLPFFRRLIDYLGGRLRDNKIPRVEAGRPLKTPLAPGDRPERLLDPEGTFHPAVIVSEGGTEYLLCQDTSLLGLWQIQTAGGRRQPAFFVDPPLAESDLKPIEEERLKEFFGREARLTGGTYQVDGGLRLDFWFLLLAGLLVALESLLIRR